MFLPWLKSIFVTLAAQGISAVIFFEPYKQKD
jgi:hypothetical protein